MTYNNEGNIIEDEVVQEQPKANISVFDHGNIPVVDYREQILALGGRAAETQAVTAATIGPKMLVDYMHFGHAPLEQSMMNLLFSRDYIERARPGSTNMISIDGLMSSDNQARLMTGPVMIPGQGPMPGMPNVEFQAWIDGPTGRHRIRYQDGSLQSDVKNPSEMEVLSNANAMLAYEVKRQVVEIVDALQYIEKTQTTLPRSSSIDIAAIRSKELKKLEQRKPEKISKVVTSQKTIASKTLKDEQDNGYQDTINGWSLDARPMTVTPQIYDEVETNIKVIARKGDREYTNSIKFTMDDIPRSTSEEIGFDIEVDYNAHAGGDIEEVNNALEIFVAKSATIKHYFDLSDSQRILESQPNKNESVFARQPSHYEIEPVQSRKQQLPNRVGTEVHSLLSAVPNARQLAMRLAKEVPTIEAAVHAPRELSLAKKALGHSR